MSSFNTAAVLAALALALAFAGSATASPLSITRRDTGVLIHPSLDTSFCLATPSPPSNGISPQFVKCDTTQTSDPNAEGYALWDISEGNNPDGIVLTGTEFCLDAGSNPDAVSGTPAAPLKIWQCYPGLQQQVWYYTEDEHIAVTGSVPCIAFGRYGTFLDKCSSNDNAGSQTFSIEKPGGSTPPTTTTTVVVPSMTPSSSAPATTATVTPPPSNGGTRIHPNGDDGLCLNVVGGEFGNGVSVNVAKCDGGRFQAWSINRGSGQVSINGGAFCLDFGTGGGSNGTPMKIWQCYPGLFQQTLYYTDSPDNHIAVVGGNQCLDVARGTNNVQSWQCSGTDVQQLWTV